MLIIHGRCGTYMTFADTDEVENLINNLKDMMDTKEQPLVYGKASDSISTREFDEEYKLMQEMIANDLTMRARGGG